MFSVLRHAVLSSVAAMAITFVGAGIGQAAILPINNPSFEDGPLFPSTASGWSHSGVSGVTTISYPSAGFNTGPSDNTNRVWFTNDYPFLDQATSHVIQDGYTYTLSADLGKNQVSVHNFASINLGLLAFDGPTFVGQVMSETVTFAEIPLGGFARFSGSFDADSSLAGKTLFIRFFIDGPGLDQPVIDVVQLEETPTVPEPASVSLVGFAGLVLAFRRRSRLAV